MPVPGRTASLGRSVRLLRQLAALAVIVALAAIVSIVKGDSGNHGRALVAAAMILGTAALLGLGFAGWPYIKKGKNDSRP